MPRPSGVSTEPSPDRPSLTCGVYLCAADVLSLAAEPATFRRAEQALRRCGFTKVWIEGYRGGVVVSPPQLRHVRDRFHDAGFATAGGFMPVCGAGFGVPATGPGWRSGTFCYTSPRTRRDLRRVVRNLAAVFGTIIVDDAFETTCQCLRCQRARGTADWGAFRRALLADVARECFIEPAHTVNRRARVIVKFPQYYDRYTAFGYDPAEFPRIFDGVWLGTETRNPLTVEYGYVEQAEAFVHYRWMTACARGRLQGAWFDYLDCDANVFLEQAVTSIAAGAREIVLFCYRDQLFAPGNPLMRAWRKYLPALHDLAGRLPTQGFAGIRVWLPHHPAPLRDGFLCDMVPMWGIPCLPTPQATDALGPAVLITDHAHEDPRWPAYLRRVLRSARSVLLTFSAAQRIQEQHPRVARQYGLHHVHLEHLTLQTNAFGTTSGVHRPEYPVRLGGDIHADSARVTVWADVEGFGKEASHVPFIISLAEADPRITLLNVAAIAPSDFSLRECVNVPCQTGLAYLPPDVLAALRHALLTPLDAALEAPGRVALYLWDDGQALAANHGARRAAVTLRWRGQTHRTVVPPRQWRCAPPP